jgi:hypothetical protein
MSAISSLRNRRLGEARASHLQARIPSQPPSMESSWTPPARLEKKWMVYVEGGEVVGPVSADQIARALKAGMIPMEASVQREGEVFWDGILDQPAIIAALKSL